MMEPVETETRHIMQAMITAVSESRTRFEISDQYLYKVVFGGGLKELGYSQGQIDFVEKKFQVLFGGLIQGFDDRWGYGSFSNGLDLLEGEFQASKQRAEEEEQERWRLIGGFVHMFND